MELRMNTSNGWGVDDSDGLIFDAYVATQAGEVFAQVGFTQPRSAQLQLHCAAVCCSQHCVVRTLVSDSHV